jgi:hypothetical protein
MIVRTAPAAYSVPYAELRAEVNGAFGRVVG